MASFRALLLLLAVPLSAASAGSEELSDALATDSECMAHSSGGGGPDCGLNALQMSARKAGGAKQDEVRSAWPAWCNFIPTGLLPSVCTSSAACTCQPYCSTAHPESWQWNLHCCSCRAALLQADSQAGRDGDEELSAWPAWCQFIRTSLMPSVCTAKMACTCQQYCSMTLPESWQWNQECCSCGTVLLQADSQASAEFSKAQHHAAGTPQAGSGQPAWCVSIPEGSKPTACTAPGSCTCASFCSDFDSGSWKWNPVCCGCQL